MGISQERTTKPRKHKAFGIVLIALIVGGLFIYDRSQPTPEQIKAREEAEQRARFLRDQQAWLNQYGREYQADLGQAYRQREIDEAQRQQDLLNPSAMFGKPIVESFAANVVSIIDGDTLTVMNESGEPIEIRLDLIEAPDIEQAFGAQAKQSLRELCDGKSVQILKTDRQNETTFAFVLVDGANINETMIRDGFAWHAEGSDDPNLALLENESRLAKLGLWTDAEPVAPWEWRKSEQ